MTGDDFDGEVALLLRPIPSTMAAKNDAIRIGGLPRLPDDLEWPCQDDGTPTHFFAEIDLARLPRTHGAHAVPDLPKKGTLFVFAPMGEESFHGAMKPQVLFTRKSVAKQAEREPPSGLPNVLEYDPSYMDEDGMTHEGTVLLRRHIEVLPFLSPKPVPYFDEMAGDFRGVELDREAIDAKAEKAREDLRRNLAQALQSGRALPEPEKIDSTPSGTGRPKIIPGDYRRRILADEEPSGFAPISWDFVFDWARFFTNHCLRLARNELLRMLDVAQKGGADPTEWLDHLMANDKAIERAEGIRRSREAWQHKAPNAEPPGATAPFDEQALRWLQIAAEAKGALTPAQRNAFVATLNEIKKQATAKEEDVNNHWVMKTFAGAELEEEAEPTRLYPSGIAALDSLVPETTVHVGATYLAALDAYELAGRLEQARSDAAVGLDADESQAERWDQRLLQANAESMAAHDRFDKLFGAEPLQMFGMAKGFQSEALDHVFGDDVLLLQIGDAAGLPYDLSDGVVMHLWIAPGDLAKGKFDRVEATVSMS